MIITTGPRAAQPPFSSALARPVSSTVMLNNMKFKSNTKYHLLIYVIILFFLKNIALCNEFKHGGEDVILSNGSNLIKCSINNFKISNPSTLLDSKKWRYVTWPSFDKQNNLVYVQAQNTDFGLDWFIFSLSIKPFGKNVKKIVRGFYPAISYNGKYLTYYKHPNQLRIIDLTKSENHLLVSDVAKSQPAVWIDNHTLLYSDAEYKMMKIDIHTLKVEDTRHNFIIPGIISPNKDRVLCGNYSGDRIYIYTVKTNQAEEVKRSSFLSFGTNFVWLKNSQRFLYTRQTFLNVIKLQETRSLFLYTSEKKEDKMIELFALFGGIHL